MSFNMFQHFVWEHIEGLVRLILFWTAEELVATEGCGWRGSLDEFVSSRADWSRTSGRDW